jgi:hypothetical protein
MAEYIIKSPDGTKVKVNAPEGASQVDVLNYAFEQFSQSMDPIALRNAQTKNDAFGEFLRARVSQPREGETEAQTFQRLYGGLNPDVGTGEGMARAYTQGSMFGGGDEFVAAGAAGLNLLAGKDPGKTYGELYGAYAGRERDKLRQFREDSPVAAYGSEIVGAIPTAMLGVLNAPRAATTTGRVASGFGTGAGQGALYGYAAGDGDVADRLESAAATAAIAGPIGAAAVPLSAGVGKLARTLLERRFANQAGMPRAVIDKLNEIMSVDDSFTGAGAQRIEAAGEGAMLADAGPAATSALDMVMASGGRSANIAKKAVADRVTAASRSMTGALDSTLGAPQGVRRTARDIASSTRTPRQEAYDLAYSIPINYAAATGKAIEAALERIPSRVLRAAIETANESMQAVGARNKQILADIAEDGSVVFREMPNVQQLDAIKRALGEAGAEAVDQFGRRTGAGTRANTLARELRDAVTDAVPEYGVAVRLGGDKIERDTALRLGSDLLKNKTTREMVAEAVDAGMSQEAREAALMGLRSTIDDAMANVKRALTDGNMTAREAVAMLKQLSSRANREKVTMLLGRESAEKLFGELDRATMAFELRAATAANSATHVRGVLKESVDSLVDDSTVHALRGGRPWDAARNLAAKLLGGSAKDRAKITDETYSALAQALTSKPMPQTLRDLAVIPRAVQSIANRRSRLAEDLMRQNVAVTGPAYQGRR